jgi:hypothetical protein
MKVDTDIKAGNFIVEAAQQADQVVGQVTAVAVDAGQKANNLVQDVRQRVGKFWGCVTSF